MTSGAGSTTSGVVSGSLGSREINYILRVLGPAACRNPECFAETASNCVRIALPAPRGAGTGERAGFLSRSGNFGLDLKLITVELFTEFLCSMQGRF